MPRVLALADVFREAFAHEAAGRDDLALALYRDVLAAVPDHPGALLRLAHMDLRRGDLASARAGLAKALDAAKAAHLPTADIHVAQGALEKRTGRIADARRAFDAALLEVPLHPGATLEAANLDHEHGDFAGAEKRLRALLERHPDLALAWVNLALALEARGQSAQAGAALARATGLANAPPLAFVHAARLALHVGERHAAKRYVEQGLGRFPNDPGLLHQSAVALRAGGDAIGARRLLEDALLRASDDAGLRVTLGAMCLDGGDAALALRHLEDARALGADSAESWDNLGAARLACGDPAGAQQAFERAVSRDPRLTPALANLVHARRQNCEWQGLDALDAALITTLHDPRGDRRWPPFIALAMDLSPAQQHDVARGFCEATLPAPCEYDAAEGAAAAAADDRRLRIGYLGSEFREHATGRLMAGVFEAHDRSLVEIFVYDHGREDGSFVEQRIRNACDHWRAVAALSDRDIAERIRQDRIDVLVDCKGHTRGNRLGVLAFRPAVLQVHYMGYPGTLGYAAVDAIIGDAEVVPPGDEPHFTERVLRMPRCYFATDAARPLPPVDSRAAQGLPDDALVLACFNQPYKITAPFFAVWLRALRHEPAAVLWLLATSDTQMKNLAREAERGGVDPSRVVFARPLAPDAHLARIGCADLTLDTLPVNQHTTACDALWVGVPMLTCKGRTFAGRVGASLLQASGLGDLVTSSLADYERLLLEIVADRERLARYRAHLVNARNALPLFDTPGLTRELEALLAREHARCLAVGRRASRPR